MDEEEEGLYDLVGGPGFLTIIGPDDLQETYEHEGREYHLYFLESPTGWENEELPPAWAIKTASEHDPSGYVWAFLNGGFSIERVRDIIANSVKAEMVGEKPE